MTTGCYGRKPFVADDRDLTWAAVRPSGLVVPHVPKPHGGFGMDFVDWLMLNNGPSNAWPQGWAAARGCGNCTIADKLHAFMESAKNAGRPIPPFSDKSGVRNYQTLTKLANGSPYNPQTGEGDTGLEIRTVLDHCQKVGLGDDWGILHRIGPYVLVDHTNPQEVWEVLWFAEHVSLGINATQSMEDQVNANQTITWDPNSPKLGGHDLLLAGHPSNNIWAGVQWGQRTPMTEEFRLKASEEAWTWFDPAEISAKTGTNYEGVNADQLNAYLQAVAKEFPQQ
jgi:hypothetical protein